MQPLKCPHCGAPASVPPHTPVFTCTYCRQSFNTGLGAQPQIQQQIIVIAPGATSDVADATDRAVSSGVSWMFRLLIPVILLAVIVPVFLATGGIHAAGTMLGGFAWDGKAPLDCAGNDDLEVKGVHAEFNAGSAIVASGNCKVTCTDCVIKAPIAIEAAGNAQVTILNGEVEGSELLADATGNAKVTLSGNVTFKGSVKRAGNARVNAPSSSSKK